MNNFDILDKMTEDYKKLEYVSAIVLGGSSTVNNDDNKSDFDIYIYCTKEPPVSKRRDIAYKYSDAPEIDNHYFETGDVYRLRATGKPIDIMYRSLESIERNIEWVWENHNACLGYTTCFIDNVNKSKILYDKNGWFVQLQKRTRTPYPQKLADNIIKKNFSYLKDVMFSYYDQLESAIIRHDFVSINHRTAAFLASYFDIIFAKNKILHPGEKKLVEFALENCSTLPENFENDVKSLAIGAIDLKLNTAENMVENLRIIL